MSKDDLYNVLKEVVLYLEGIKPVLMESYEVEKKSDESLVTSIDHLIDKLLKGKLVEILPGSGFISEESEGVEKEYTWIIDPIDGTTNFINGLPYAISVALKKGDDVILGVVYDPGKNEIYHAIKGEGAYVYHKVENERLEVKTEKSERDLLIFGVPYDRSKFIKICKVVDCLADSFADIKRIGPSSLDICRVAKGSAAIYAELDLKIWDIAAARLILEEAGGIFKKIDDLYIFVGIEDYADRLY